ncbi:MAG TPA: CHAT domain-containing protein, partial [Lacipirellulaceae bacterium]|nr:CHAT domain-containing protein [Lacipirellulaceae bacterium]
LHRQNEQALLILSRVEVYRALLHKAEAKYTEAGNSVRESRKLREQVGDTGDDILAYHLAEASVRLAQARDLMQQRKASNQDPSVQAILDEAEHALDRAQPMCEAVLTPGDVRKSNAALPYRYLRALLIRLRGNSDSAANSFLELAQNCEQQGDMKTAAKCYMQLAELTMDALAHSHLKPADPGSSDSADISRMRAVELRKSKLNRYTEVARAADYADRAVTIFSQMDTSPEDEIAATALPSLHFQASYLDARLQITLAALENHIARMDELLTSSASNSTDNESAPFRKPPSIDYRQRAIELLEDAVHQAERPASSTTQVRLQRARFFSRYAPAYDMLVDLYVASAVGLAETEKLAQSSQSFANLRRAIEIADLARNRTFREQIDGWRQAAGAEVNSVSFEWSRDIGKLADSNTALLIYHLDGPQLLDLGASRGGSDVAPLSGGHLFAVLEGGTHIQHFRLHYKAPGAASSVSLSRDLAAQLVRRQLGWIENPESTRDWGHAEQRALTECLLPQELLNRLVDPSAPRSNKRLVIITDGALHQLPFESLLMPESRDSADRRIHYVLDDLPPLRYGPSLSVLAKIADFKPRPNQSTEQLLTVGNPAYPTDERQRAIPSWQELLRQMPTDGGHFVPLTHSEDESNAVYASFNESPPNGRTRLLQAAATEAEVRKHISNAQLVHIAAHGCVDYQNDNLCGGLVLTPGSDPKDTLNDGLLQLREIYSLDLSHCDLAVLSACQTFVGPERPLEAGTSMARAFLEQGARRVICSQWSTDDRATTDLMKTFFDALQSARREGKAIDYAAALHDAKLALRRDSERGSMPKYWAAFVLVGAP